MARSIGALALVCLALACFAVACSTVNAGQVAAETESWASSPVEYVQALMVDDLEDAIPFGVEEDVQMVEMAAETVPRTATVAPARPAAVKSVPAVAAAKPRAAAAAKKPRTPVSRMTKAQFKAMLNTKAPKKRTGGKGVTPKKRATKATPAAAAGAAARPAAAAAVAKGHRFAEVDSGVDMEAEAEVDMEALLDAEAEAENEMEGLLDAEAEAEADAEAEAEAEMEAEQEGPAGAGGRAGSSGGTGGSSGGTGGSSGGTGGSAGRKGGSSGGTGGSSGGTGGSSGGTGGSSGGTGGSSGGTGGSSGGTGGSSGGTGGSAGGRNSVIVAPTSAAAGLAWDGKGMNSDAVDTAFGRGTFDTYFKKAPVKLSTSARAMPTQAQCGSCWAQSAIGSLEDRLKKNNKFKGSLSIQAAIDCVKSSESAGCEGGTPMDVLEYFKTHPLPLESEYPYTGVVGACNLPERGLVLSNGWTQVGMKCTSGVCPHVINNELDMLKALTGPKVVPLIAYVDASAWQDYRNGFFPSSKCSNNADVGNHVVQIIGYNAMKSGVNVDKAGQLGYWIVKNSWGDDWGDKGQIYLPFGVNACGIANFVGYAA